MPSKRAAVVVLTAALVTGATAGMGAATANVDPWGLIGLTATPPPAAEAPTRKLTPTSTATVTADPTGAPTAKAAKPTQPTAYVAAELVDQRFDVPRGWEPRERGTRWRDYLDPTGDLRLRVRLDKHGDTAESAARSAYEKRGDEVERFRSSGVDRITAPEGTSVYYEFRYTYVESGDTRQAVEWYVDGSTMIGGFGWAGQLHLVEPAMERTLEALLDGRR